MLIWADHPPAWFKAAVAARKRHLRREQAAENQPAESARTASSPSRTGGTTKAGGNPGDEGVLDPPTPAASRSLTVEPFLD